MSINNSKSKRKVNRKVNKVIESPLPKRMLTFPSPMHKIIWKFYEIAVILLPIIIMLSHWIVFYSFSQNTQELIYYKNNEICIAWLYIMVYLYLPLMLLPASFFFGWCHFWRVPFIYFIFINIERIVYGSWFCTQNMIDTHYILIYCILGVYIMELIEVICRKKTYIITLIKNLYSYSKLIYNKLVTKI